MKSASTQDFDTDVRKNALEFYEDMIYKHLKNQGMIDGAFPDITFSKESRKIVTLNDIEITKRLYKVLLELHENHCLIVLKEALLEDCCVSVVEKAVEITKKFRNILIQYKILSNPNEMSVSNVRVNGCVPYAERQEIVDFLNFLEISLDTRVTNIKKWMKDIDGFNSLLDDMLNEYEHDDGVNDMDCY